MKNLFKVLTLLSITIFNTNAQCVDPSLIDPNSACITLYDPVCGCDGNTYSNSCFATIEGGVTSYTQGECPPNNTECIDPSLIDPNGLCVLLYHPVCGCNGKTYSNGCFATIEGGVRSYTQGACPPTESYNICAGESVEIGFPFFIGNTLLTWNPATDLSCTSCPNPIASPSVTTIYELTIFTTIGFTTEYQYYEVIVEDDCPCEEGVFPEGTYLYTLGTQDIPQSTATAFYSWKDVVWTDNLCDWFWDFDNGTTSTESNPGEIGFPVSQNGQPVTEPYNICLTVKDCNGNIEIDCCEKFYPLGVEPPVCSLPPDTGPCDGICPRWYYDSSTQDCLEFDWGCCDGNANNFESYEVCISACDPVCDTNNLPWLQLPTCDNCFSKVEVIEYDNQTLIAFWADDIACSDAMTIVHNCDGSVYCYQGGIAGFQQCNDLIAAFTQVETLWDKNTDCGPNACPAILNLGTQPLNTSTRLAQHIIYGGKINPDQNVKFGVSDRLTIENGFTVPAESEFKVEVIECN